jgi:hypothetical protein
MTKPYEPPKQDVYDHVERAVRVVASVFGAGALGELVQKPIEFRRSKWMEEVAEGLRKLEETVDAFKIENLERSEEFTTAVLHASQAAMRTHQHEKRAALRNAVLNVALGRVPDDDLQLIFLHLVDAFTPLHLRVLRFFSDPAANERASALVANTMAGGLGRVLEAAIPELQGQREFYDLLYKDLVDRGLLVGGGLQVTMTKGGLLTKRSSKLGDQFLAFVRSPLD